MKAVVVAHGDVDPRDRAHLDGADLIVAADGGTLALEGWGFVPHAIVGDLDSLGVERAAEYAARGVAVVPYSPEKDESDLELAIAYATAATPDEIVLLGILGGARFDHELANTLLIAADEVQGRSMRAVRGDVTVRALHGGERLELAGAAGDLVTLLAVGGDAEGVRTQGLRYALAGETLHFGAARGLSNIVMSRPASVTCDRGVLLVIETQTHSGGAS
ncbi:MAG TPA: thiamine diphosphokinase [Candidatus Limnocylindria bacterium]|nr:thiamine diphosphokinase [Candidatus Limnocylindria bacterium]